MIKGLLEGAFPEDLPDLWFGVVDVRVVADLHLRAMTALAAAGEQFIAVSGAPLSLLDVATILREAFGDAAAKVPSRSSLVPSERRARHATNAKAADMLGWTPRPSREATIASAESWRG